MPATHRTTSGTLHQLASLTTTPDVYPLGCDQESSGVSSRPGVYGDVNGGALPVSAQVVSTGSGNSVRTRTYSNGFTTVAQHLESTLPTASAVAISDLNKDGNDDIVVVNAYQATTAFVSVMLGNPDGTYKTPVSYPTAGQKSVAAVIEDVNNDGTLDLIVASDDQHISVLIGKGDGTFNSAQSFSAPLNGSTDPNFTPILSLITADLNNDGNKDIVCGNGLVLLGHGDGTFTQLATVALSFLSNQHLRPGAGTRYRRPQPGWQARPHYHRRPHHQYLAGQRRWNLYTRSRVRLRQQLRIPHRP